MVNSHATHTGGGGDVAEPYGLNGFRECGLSWRAGQASPRLETEQMLHRGGGWGGRLQCICVLVRSRTKHPTFVNTD